MKKIKLLIFLFISVFLVSCNDDELNKLKLENEELKTKIEALEQENNKLKDTAEIYWQNAVDKFNSRKYLETKEILKNLIEKFPTSNLIGKSKEKIKEIELIEKNKTEEENKLIKIISNEINKKKNALDIEKILDDFDKKYDDTYSKLKNAINEKRNKIKQELENAKEMQKKLQKLGITITDIYTYFDKYGSPTITFNVQNILNTRREMRFECFFVFEDSKELIEKFSDSIDLESNYKGRIKITPPGTGHVYEYCVHNKKNIHCKLYMTDYSIRVKDFFIGTFELSYLS